jgi:hypothetical protein
MSAALIPGTYGDYRVLGYEGSRRRHEFIPRDGGRSVVESAFCAGPEDRTPVHIIYGGYDAKCSCCWHGFSHTEGEHVRSVGAP